MNNIPTIPVKADELQAYLKVSQDMLNERFSQGDAESISTMIMSCALTLSVPKIKELPYYDRPVWLLKSLLSCLVEMRDLGAIDLTPKALREHIRNSK